MGDIPTETLRQQDLQRSQLMDAIRRNDTDRIDQLVKSGAPLYLHYFHPDFMPQTTEPHIRDGALVNPVDWAALELRFRAAMQLLELGDERRCMTEARPRPKKLPHIDLSGQTQVALNKASQHGHLGLMKMLLERGASVAQKNREGYSALHMAVHAGKTEAVTLLLQFKAWDCEEHKGEVLQLAQQRGLGLLLAETTGGDECPGGAAMAPVEPPQGSKAKEQASPRLSTPSTRPCTAPVSPAGTPSAGARRAEWMQQGMSNAVTQGPVQRASGPRPDGFADWGWSPLDSLPKTPMSAASGGVVSHAKPVFSSVTQHALSSTDVRLRGELCSAIRKGSVDKIAALVARGAPLEAAFDLGYGAQGNCVDWACVSGRPDVALKLLEHADERGIGDLLAIEAGHGFFWCVSQGYLAALQELLRRGADVGQRSPMRTTLDHDGDPETALCAAVAGSRKEEMLVLLRHGAWERESEASREKLLELATRRRFVAEAFTEAGIGNFDAFLAPLQLPFEEHGVWGPDYPRPAPIHWEAKPPAEAAEVSDPPAAGAPEQPANNAEACEN